MQPEQLHAPFEKALREGHLIPICCIGPHRSRGEGTAQCVQMLLPNPLEGNPEPLVMLNSAAAVELQAIPDPGEHAVVRVQGSDDPFIGKRIFRIHQGSITKDSQLLIGEGR